MFQRGKCRVKKKFKQEKKMLNEEGREIVVNIGKTDVQERGGLVGWMHCEREI